MVSAEGGPVRDAHAAPAGGERLAPVIRLRPIRTLVISTELAYRERALMVLADLGPVAFAVASPSEPGDVESLLREEPADVAVLDATGCEPAARRVIAALARSSPRTGIVVVCHHCTEESRELDALPKWGWTQDLRTAVERAYRDGNPLGPPLGSLRRPPRAGGCWPARCSGADR